MKVHSCVFYTVDIDSVKKFYHDLLGFVVERQNPEYISFIFENNVRIGIKKGVKDREIGGHGTVFILVDDIENLYNKLKSMDIRFYKELTVQPWATSFSILDPDGNKVEFVDR